MPLLPTDNSAVGQWMAKPFGRVVPFPLSRNGRNVYKAVPESTKPVQPWRPTPGCPNCRRHVLLVIRGVTQLALR